MSSFTTELKVRPLDDGKHWVVLEPFTYYVEEIGSRTFITVHAGFITDFASVPRPLWSILPPWGKYGKAAVIHDYLWLQNSMMTNGVSSPVSKAVANNIFLEAMTVLKVKRVVRYPMYWAVSLNALYTKIFKKQ